MKRIVQYLLIFAFFLSLFSQEDSKVASLYADKPAVQVGKIQSESFVTSDFLSLIKSVGEFDFEVEDEDEDEVDHNHTFLVDKSDVSFPVVIQNISWFSSYQETKPTKLYILFHSWKSFLFV